MSDEIDAPVLITGGGGFLGSAIAAMLRERGRQVRSFARSRHEVLDLIGVEQVRGDIADRAAVSDAVRGCGTVFHVAALAGIWGPYAAYHRTNVLGTENVVAACREHRVPRLVYTSSPSVVFTGHDLEGVDESAPYADRYDAAYPATKAIAEKLVLASNDASMATVALRPHLIWGPGDNNILPRVFARARARRLFRIGDRNPLIDLTYIDNAAIAHVLAGEKLAPGSPIAGKAYFVAQGQPVPLWEMVNRFLEIAGIPPVRRSVPRSVAVAIGGLMEGLYGAFRLSGEPRMTRFLARELSTAHWYNLDAARRDLGYEPLVSIEEGLRRLAAHLSARTAPPSVPA
ncbi:3 beta-hydroxysteroid dehydrogenase/Delta 5--_4-isomerase [Aquisphaera giovannonii]|uniref:3 beta-hydroxysteroid dehydrogenase/Delta 5-->4-isomerase n=1 Tax=Aquisphaera giovannonii TaxID=406548 RepID=A0A5B9W8Z7_9BACT|nr:NAD-dependent epimerase/dehydratase family protein [Aquisphaera giovannonii]QEH37096.1 3 beta-hydroxysteroid dehydrogenase/Delta 5-->4-isomerase [Aquisphaera giovannonii]